MKISKFTVYLFSLVLASSILAQETKPGIAVYSLEGRSISPDEALALTDRLRSVLSSLPEFSQQYSMTERNEMEKVLKEQALQLTGACSEASCIKQIGQILAVKKMIGGSVSKVGQIYTVEIRLIDVENGTIDKSVTEDFSGGIEMLLTKTMPKIARRLVGAEEAQKQIFGGNAKLYLKSDPPGGAIYIDEQPVGQVTPVTLEGLLPGTHTLRVETAAHEKDTVVMLVARDLKALNLSLTKKVRKLRVSTLPQEASVYIDTTMQGKTPIEKILSYDGRIALTIKMPWYMTVVETLTINGPRLYDIDRTLVPCGEMIINSAPPEAAVIIDGKESGKTPATLQIPLGVHQMILKKQGYNDFEQEINMSVHETRRVNLKMTNKSAYIAVNSFPTGAKITLNQSTFLGKTPVPKKAINWGFYNILVTAPGYRDSILPLTVDKDTNYVLNVFLQRKSRAVACLASLMFPGSGQSYSGRKGWGNFYRYTGIALVATTGYMVFDHQKKVKDYDSSIEEYEAALTMDQAILCREEMISANGQAEESLKLLQTFVTYTAVLWGINWIDAVAFFPGKPKMKAEVKQSQNGQKAGLSLTYNW